MNTLTCSMVNCLHNTKEILCAFASNSIRFHNPCATNLNNAHERPIFQLSGRQLLVRGQLSTFGGPVGIS